MYRFTGINIDHFLGAELTEVSIVQYNLFFGFETQKGDKLNINIEGKWRIERNGQLFDEGNAQKHNDSLKVHCLLGKKILSYKIPTSQKIEIQFEDNLVFMIFDDSDQYESCSFSPDIYV